MIILVADDNALSRELIRELLEGSDPVADKFKFQQIFWYRTTIIDLHAQRPLVVKQTITWRCIRMFMSQPIAPA
jgi:CheY-like chemotaxis protein